MIQYGSVRNLGLENVSIKGDFVVGTIAANAYGTEFTEVYATGFVSGRLVGGLIGSFKEASSIADSYSSVALQCNNDPCGLLFGMVWDGTITRTYSRGTSNNSAGTPSQLIGHQEPGEWMTSSFFDCTLAGNCTATGAQTSATLKTASHYDTAGWDVEDVWKFDSSGTYPCLEWQSSCGTTADSDSDGTLNAADGCPTDPLKTAPGGCGCHLDESCLPTLIDTCAELQAMNNDRAEDYVLTADVDCEGFDSGDGHGFMPIGGDGGWNPFTGTFDGGGHVIRNLTIDREEHVQALFGVTLDADIRNVGVEDVDIIGLDTNAAIVGHAMWTTISQVYATGDVSGGGSIGGLVGALTEGSTLTDSYAAVDVQAEGWCGLVVGTAQHDGTAVTRTYASGDTQDCDALAVGSIVEDAAVSSTFFDCTIAGNCTAASAETTTTLQTQSHYVTDGWDFTDVWAIDAPSTYPCLRWQDGCGDGPPVCDPTDATCDGEDDDCDANVDENYSSTSTTCGVGACASTGSTSCVGGDIEDSCTPGNPAASDSTCNGIDDDCSGANDEDYTSTSTTCGIGACAATGSTSCVGGSIQDSCTVGTPAPSDGTCNGVDDDCSGANDEDYASVVTSCGVGACAATGMSSCAGGSVQSSCMPGTPSADNNCNGVDNDCDGSIDEGYVQAVISCGVGACVATGSTICVNGSVQSSCFPGQPSPSDSLCDAIDSDCDGLSDEGYVSSQTSCGVGACASTGETSCVLGAVQNDCDPGEPALSDVSCDGVDDDCNGDADEDFVASCDGTAAMHCVDGDEVVDECSDGNACNGEETCSDGECEADEAAPQDDGNPCTTDTCDPVTGLPLHAPAPVGTSCVDGNVCNGAESCQNTSVVGGCALPPANIVGWWSGDSNFDDIRGSYDSVGLNGVGFGAGRVGNGFVLAGSDSIDLSAHASVLQSNTSGKTIEMWLRTTNDSCRTIFHIYEDSSRELLIQTGDGCSSAVNSELITVTHRSIAGTSVVAATDLNRAQLIGSTFHHVAITVGGGQTLIYIDGTSRFRGISGSQGLWGGFSSPVSAAIGSSTGATNTFQGTIDEVTLYDRALTASEVQSIFNAGANGKCKQTVCTAGTPPVTNDQDACTVDSCDPVLGVQHAPAAQGTACNDQNVCTGNDICGSTGAGSCAGTALPPTSDGNACTADTCDPILGVQHSNLAIGTACNDGNVCNGPDVCARVIGSELVRNTGFETVPNNQTGSGLMPNEWVALQSTPSTYSSDGSYGLTASGAHGGLRFVQLTSTQRIGQLLTAPLQPNQSYEFTAWANNTSAGGTQGAVRIGLTPAANTTVTVVGTTQLATLNAWGQVTACFTAPSGAATLPRLSVGLTSTAIVRIDDISLRAVSSCSAIQLACLPTGVLATDDGDECTADSCNPLTGPVHTPEPPGTCDREGAGSCADGIDNDLDGYADCMDEDCESLSVIDSTCDGLNQDCDAFIDEDVDCANPACANQAPCLAETCTNNMDDDGDGLADCADLECDSDASCDEVPPDPALVAPSLDLSAARTFYSSYEYMFSGDDPIQRGVAPGTIREEQASVVSGSLHDHEGFPIPGVLVTVLGKPELGLTRTRADGAFDMVINGGGLLTFDFQKDGFFPAQREARVAWNGTTQLEPVMLLEPDEASTSIGFPSTTMQVARGSVESDADGPRQATVLFPAGVTATVTLHNGTVVPAEAVDSLTIRATEYTVGPDGGLRMPAALPAGVQYTYAVELSADGAQQVAFDQKLPMYLENFLGFPTGFDVPIGYYNRSKGVWEALDSGVVLDITGISSGAADLDVTGDGVADAAPVLAALGITAEERTRLAQLYQPGVSLWRVQVEHFSTYDLNWGIGANGDAQSPNAQFAGGQSGKPDCDSTQSGSVIHCQSQVLEERLPLAGSDLELVYKSDRVVGGGEEITISLGTADRLQAQNLLGVQVVIVGPFGHYQVKRWDRGAIPPSYTWSWNGLDREGRPVQGSGKVVATVYYEYGCAYRQTAKFGSVPANANAFVTGVTRQQIRNGASIKIPDWDMILAPCKIALPQVITKRVLSADSRYQGIGGGWTLSNHHFYDATSGTLWLGDGRKVTADQKPTVIYEHKKLPAGAQLWADVRDVNPSRQPFAVAPDGTIYVRVRYQNPDDDALLRLPYGNVDAEWERYTAPIGTEPCDEPNCIVGQHISDVVGRGIVKIAFDRDSRLIFGYADYNTLSHAVGGSSIFRVDNGGIVHLVAGTGIAPDAIPVPDGAVGTESNLNMNAWVLEVGPDGKIYFDELISSSNGNTYDYRIRYIDTDGRLGTTTIGQPTNLFKAAPNGDLYFYGSSGTFPSIKYGILRQRPNGAVDHYAIGLEAPVDEVPANDAGVGQPRRLFIDDLGRLGFVTQSQVFVVNEPDWPLIRLSGDFCGGTNTPPCDQYPADGSIAQDVWIPRISALGALGDGSVLALHKDRISILRRPGPSMLANNERIVPSPDGTELYTFTRTGHHKETRNALTGAIITRFEYGNDGRVSRVIDGDGNVTVIERTPAGALDGIVGPFGQRTELEEDENGYLSSFDANPDAPAYELTYDAGGRLTSMVDPRGGLHEYVYQGARLIEDRGPDGRVVSLSRTFEWPNTGLVTATETDGGNSSYRTDHTNSARSISSIEQPDGSTDTILHFSDGSAIAAYADETVLESRIQPDPVLGVLASLPASSTVTLPSGATLEQSTEVVVDGPTAMNPLNWLMRTVETDTNGRVSVSTFDRASRTMTYLSPEGRIWSIELDAQGRPIEVSAPDTYPVLLDYDDHGRVERLRQGTGTDAREIVYAYWNDPLHLSRQGYVQSISGPVAGETMSLVPDALGRPLSASLANGETTSLTYDPMGAVESITPPGRTAHAFDRTPAGLVEDYTAPGAVVTHNEYNLARKPLQRTLADGRQITATYDSETGKPATLVTGSGSFAFGYHATSGQLTSIARTDSFGAQTLTYGYDGPFLVSETWAGASLPSGSVSQPLNDNFWIDRLLINGAQVAQFSYDDDGLLVAAGPLTIARDADSGAIVSTALGDVSTSQTYNGFGEPSEFAATFDATEYFTETLSARDKAGRILERSEAVFDGATVITTDYDYAYDAAGRLTHVFAGGNQTSEYVYSESGGAANGNRTAHITPLGTIRGRYDAQDRLTRYCPEDGAGNAAPIAGLPCYSYTYRASGQLLAKTDLSGGGDTVAYGYDEIGALRTVFLPNDVTISYEIDGAGRRVGKRVNGNVVRRWLYKDALKVVAELDASNDVTSRFVYGTRTHVPDFVIRNGVTYRYVTDHLGSVVLVVNVATGAIAQRMTYDEFGNVLADTNPGFQPFGFAGGIYDADTGLVRYGARDHDAVTGRWTAKDPIGFGGGTTNLYEYAYGDPVNLVDPNGAFPIAPALVGGAIGAGVGALSALATGGDVAQGALIGAATGFSAGLGVGLAQAVLGAAATGYTLAEGALMAYMAGGHGVVGNYIATTAITGKEPTRAQLAATFATSALGGGASAATQGTVAAGLAGEFATAICIAPVDFGGNVATSE